MTSPRHVAFLYRGPLSSCNYDCDYCPFGKTRNTREELAEDARQLDRFVSWIDANQARFHVGVLFTPWGEALIRKPYQEALVRLSNMPGVWRAAIQTNLSNSLTWATDACRDTLGLWSTFHPTQTSIERFVERALEAHAMGLRLSVGVVGLRENFDAIEALRDALPDAVYLWINAYKRVEGYYSPEDIARLEAVDPLFRTNTVRHPSLGQACRAGSSAFSVQGDGTLQRCHFIKETIGNLYTGGLEAAMAERPCAAETCGCHIGYVHLDRLELYPLYGDGILERIPASPLWVQP